jgi:hypothetical protein
LENDLSLKNNDRNKQALSQKKSFARNTIISTTPTPTTTTTTAMTTTTTTTLPTKPPLLIANPLSSKNEFAHMITLNSFHVKQIVILDVFPSSDKSKVLFVFVFAYVSTNRILVDNNFCCVDDSISRA